MASGPAAGPVILPDGHVVVTALPPLYVTSSGIIYLDQTQLQLTTAGVLTSGSIGRSFGRCSCSPCVSAAWGCGLGGRSCC